MRTHSVLDGLNRRGRRQCGRRITAPELVAPAIRAQGNWDALSGLPFVAGRIRGSVPN